MPDTIVGWGWLDDGRMADRRKAEAVVEAMAIKTILVKCCVNKELNHATYDHVYLVIGAVGSSSAAVAIGCESVDFGSAARVDNAHTLADMWIGWRGRTRR